MEVAAARATPLTNSRTGAKLSGRCPAAHPSPANVEIEEIVRERRLLPMLKQAWEHRIQRHFELGLAGVLLVLIPVVTWFCDDRMALINLYFLPVLLAAYFLDARGAVLGGALSILVVFFYVVLSPEAFYTPHTRLGLFLHLATWGGVLILCGALVGRLNERVQVNFSQLRVRVDDWKDAQKELLRRVDALDRRNTALEGTREKLESALYSAMDPWVANMLVNRRLANEKREISVLFADIAHFTASVEEMQPEAVVRHMNRLFSELEPILASYNGHLDKYLGDGLMAEFGIPLYHQQNALQAVLAAVQMQKRVSSPDFRWKLRMGISHGEAFVGLVGSERRKAYTAFGDVVNVAARLEKICPEGSVCVDGATQSKVSRWFVTRRLVMGEKADAREQAAARLQALQERMSSGRSDCDLMLEAARLSGELGEVPQAVEYYRKALAVNPQIQERVEAAVAELVLSRESSSERSVRLRGKHKAVDTYEVVSLKDPLADLRRIPEPIRAASETRLKAMGINRDLMLPIESLDGTLGHSLVTAAIAGALAEAMGLSPEERRVSFEAGFYHDVGRRNVPEHLLNQDEMLSALPEQDLQMVRVHVEAARLVMGELGISVPPAVVDAIEAHHENFDGSGYPKRLAGQSIPRAARLVRVADEYDRLTSPRLHREGWEAAAAATELTAAAERGELDPQAVAALGTLVRSSLPGSV